jgi:hypothetical protein
MEITPTLLSNTLKVIALPTGAALLLLGIRAYYEARQYYVLRDIRELLKK